jgi:hypothetical protein
MRRTYKDLTPTSTTLTADFVDADGAVGRERQASGTAVVGRLAVRR